jgi:small glutamine-rich tetratricopeptide repeat-containing protein alpha
VKPATLKNIFDVFIKTREKTKASGAAGPAAESSSASSSKPKAPSPAVKAEAEKLKQKGNSLMTSKKYDEAIAMYTEAIALDATNPVYFSNRAAAHASKGDHLSAIGDAEEAITIDPNFVKAYSRLGYVNPSPSYSLSSRVSRIFHAPKLMLITRTCRHAQYSLEDYAASLSAFERGLALEPTNANLKSGLENAKARLASESRSSTQERSPAATTPPAAADTDSARGANNLSDILGSMGGLAGAGGAGGGGMPDLATLMNNPAIMQMASQLASNGGLASLMQDPNIADMVGELHDLLLEGVSDLSCL